MAGGHGRRRGNECLDRKKASEIMAKKNLEGEEARKNAERSESRRRSRPSTTRTTFRNDRGRVEPASSATRSCSRSKQSLHHENAIEGHVKKENGRDDESEDDGKGGIDEGGGERKGRVVPEEGEGQGSGFDEG